MKLHHSNIFIMVQNLHGYPPVWCSLNLKKVFKEFRMQKWSFLIISFIFCLLSWGESPKPKNSLIFRIYFSCHIFQIITSSIRNLFFFNLFFLFPTIVLCKIKQVFEYRIQKKTHNIFFLKSINQKAWNSSWILFLVSILKWNSVLKQYILILCIFSVLLHN